MSRTHDFPDFNPDTGLDTQPMSPRRPLPLDFTLAPFTLDEARALGFTEKRLRASDLVIPVRGVRLLREEAKSLTSRCRALALHLGASPAAFSHATAAMLWELPLPRRLQEMRSLHVTVWGGAYPPRVADVVGHRTSDPPRTARRNGLQLIAAPDAWCQLSAGLGEVELIQAGDRLLGRPHPLATIEEIDEAIERYGKRRGCRVLRDARPHLRACSESPKETELRLEMIAAAFPDAEPNGVIMLRSGRKTHGDLVYRQWKVLLEYDGEHHRESGSQWSKDVDRLNELAANGWLVIRVNKHSRFDDVARQVSEALELRGWVRAESPGRAATASDAASTRVGAAR
ncbi:DUF559 domain-containing protein [Agromyces sp. Marseille-P2726]|uniref:DUF559 domain-containing protein n=1 Tax=Agromyces sp. Marseille-P2726 TaxID=2709132 RepID=UPI00156DDAF6|nr:DUF559 domain-containing protein [Agromyces sp. Marseille-P2726]